jgi:CDP-diglyceride synthetase
MTEPLTHDAQLKRAKDWKDYSGGIRLFLVTGAILTFGGLFDFIHLGILLTLLIAAATGAGLFFYLKRDALAKAEAAALAAAQK